MPEKYDVIVVGAGMGGGILASRIAERGVNPRTGEKLRIALMDMGPYVKGDPRPGYGIPSRRAAFANVPGTDDTVALGVTPWGTAAGIGGQTNHWGCNVELPNEESHEDWIRETGVDWTYDKFADARTEFIEMFHVTEQPEELLAPGSIKFREAAAKMGYKPYRHPMAVANCIQCGHCAEKGCKYDSKASTLISYIPIAERHGVTIIPNAMVEKVILEKKGAAVLATGVGYTRAGTAEQANADYVILGCGNTGSPRLLFNSGYGPRDRVRNLILENPNVGKVDNIETLNLMWGVFPEPVKRADVGQNSGYMIEARGPNGYMNIDLSELFGFHGFIGNYQYQIAVNDIATDFGREHKEYMKKWRHFGGLSTDVYRQKYVTGEISPDGRLIVNRGHPEILKRAQQAKEIARDVLLKMGARRTTEISAVGFTTAMSGGVPVPGVGNTQPVGGSSGGGCRAGSDRSNSVINSDFECHDISNLFLCDNGVVPGGAGGAITAYVACHAWRRIVAKHFS